MKTDKPDPLEKHACRKISAIWYEYDMIVLYFIFDSQRQMQGIQWIVLLFNYIPHIIWQNIFTKKQTKNI